MKRQDIKNLLCEVMIVAAVLSGCSIEITQTCSKRHLPPTRRSASKEDPHDLEEYGAAG